MNGDILFGRFHKKFVSAVITPAAIIILIALFGDTTLADAIFSGTTLYLIFIPVMKLLCPRLAGFGMVGKIFGIWVCLMISLGAVFVVCDILSYVPLIGDIIDSARAKPSENQYPVIGSLFMIIVLVFNAVRAFFKYEKALW